jgi:hypothetical protein
MDPKAMRHGVFRITQRLYQGNFPSENDLPYIEEQGITHLFNVSENPAPIAAGEGGVKRVVHRPVGDFARIPTEDAIDCLDRLHGMLAEKGSKVFIHCLAGQNRSPTILWLYLIACGVNRDDARYMIGDRTLEAIPAHPMLIDEELVADVIEYGKKHFLPLADPSVVEPA